MHEWNATTMTMAKPRRLLRAKLDLVMLPDRYRISSYRQSGPRYRAAWRASEGPAAFSHRGHYALIRRPYNACVPGHRVETRLQSQQIAECASLAYGVAAHGRPLT